jgi:hypothetical protein
MPQQNGREPDPQYGETVDPKNPPNSVTRRDVGRATIRGFLGSAIVFFFVVAAALLYWSFSDRRINPDPGLRGDGTEVREGIGTAGERSPGTDLPGGSDPALRPDSTRDEIEDRGGDGSSRNLPLTRLDMILETGAGGTVGRRVDLKNADVATAGKESFWIHDGDARIEVLPPAGAPAVSPGQAVDVSGVVESDGRGGTRIRAGSVTSR